MSPVLVQPEPLWWVTGAVANAVIASAYFAIVYAIVAPLVRSGQLRHNPLGAATAAIFFSCAVHHGGHVVHMLLPALDAEHGRGLAMRASYDWEMAAWDVLSALIGVYYWSLRRTYGSLMHGAQLFEDMRARERQALELNDAVLQSMVVAKMALDLDDHERAEEALGGAIDAASQLISDLLGPGGERDAARLTRGRPATLRETS